MRRLLRLVAFDESLPPFDIHCPLMSLPLAFGTTLQTIPRSVPYLHADTNPEYRARGPAVAKLDGPVVIWELQTAVPGKRFECKAGDSMSVSSDGSKLATWHNYSSKQAVIGDFNGGTSTSLTLPDRVMHVAWHPNSIRLAAAMVDGNIYQCDVSKIGIGSRWPLFWTNPQPLSTLTGHYQNAWLRGGRDRASLPGPVPPGVRVKGNVLALNHPDDLAVREEMLLQGRFPYPT